MKKEIVYLIGNCQAFPLGTILGMSDSFVRRFELVRFPAVHVAKPAEVERLHASLSHADLLISQPISASYRGNIGLGTEALRLKLGEGADFISWPSLFFPSYNPELFYLKDENGASVNNTFDYHVRPIFEAYAAGLDEHECAQAYRDASPSGLQDTDRILSSLQHRENTLSVKSSEFIAAHFRAQRLFHTFNHPATPVLLHVAQQILELLDLKDDLPQSLPIDLLNSTVYPITRSVRDRLALDFSEPEIVRVRGIERTVQETIRSYYLFYDANPDLVQSNAKHVFS